LRDAFPRRVVRKAIVQGQELSKNVVVSAGLQPDPMGSSRASVASQSWFLFKAKGLVFCAPMLFCHGLWVAPRVWGM